MRRLRWPLIAVAAVLVILGFLAAAVMIRAESLIAIENRAARPVRISVDMANPGAFSWTGELASGQRVLRTARFSDNSFIVVCRNADGIHRSRGGYVTNGAPFLVNITVDGCEAIKIDVETMP